MDSQLVLSKVDNPYVVAFLIRTPIFEWYGVWCGSETGYQKAMCLKEIGLRAPDMMTILDSIFNIIGGSYMTILRA